MAFESEFLDFMTSTVTITPWSSQDGYAEPGFGTAVAYDARIVDRVRTVRGFDGREAVSTRQIYLAATAAIDGRSKVTLPSGFTPQQPPIISVGRSPDEAGDIHHVVLYV